MPKICGNKECKIPNPEFHKSNTEKNGLQFFCKICRKVKDVEYGKTERGKETKRQSAYNFRKSEKGKNYIKSYCENNREKLKNAALIRKYGISLEQWKEILKNQNSSCAICRTSEKKLKIDHCHITGKVRGLLCHNCNVALGLFKDNSAVLIKAAEYVKYTLKK